MRSIVSFIVVTAFVVMAHSGFAAQKGRTSSAQNKATAKKMYGWFNADNWDSVATVIPADYIEHDPDQGQKPGLDGLKEMFKQYRATFPDLKMELKDISADGDLVMTRVVITGTMNGKMMEMPPNGKKMEVEMFEQMRFKDGKAVEHWGVFDSMKMMTQLGLMPGPGEADKK